MYCQDYGHILRFYCDEHAYLSQGTQNLEKQVKKAYSNQEPIKMEKQNKKAKEEWQASLIKSKNKKLFFHCLIAIITYWF